MFWFDKAKIRLPNLRRLTSEQRPGKKDGTSFHHIHPIIILILSLHLEYMDGSLFSRENLVPFIFENLTFEGLAAIRSLRSADSNTETHPLMATVPAAEPGHELTRQMLLPGN